MAGSGASAQLELKGRPMREHDYTTLFKTAHMLKDVRLCLEEAEAGGRARSRRPHTHARCSPRPWAADTARTTTRRLIEAIEGFAGRSLK